ncbi:AP-3 complex subunit delta-1-like [Centruroides sculpturatus]|uniref:AP-3 complex subunit delta-1-like n=1 Tax=Centruroides sculpturatus TaxID=218467 RepID=UPI000C6CCE1D|nr:AP-3 complex subunit delta-1-like [Centruroides sculpturatus]
MLGYDISWAAFNIIEVMSSTKFTFKRVGYLAASQSFYEETDVLMLTTNMIRKDLNSQNMYDAGTAMSGLSCFVTPDLARDLANDVMTLLTSTKPYLRKKAVLLMYKIFLQFPEALRPAFPRLKEKLEDPDPGVQSAAVNVICELARKNPKNYLSLAPVFFKLMTSSTNNWMLIKIIKLFGALTPLEPRLGKKLIEPLTNLIYSTSAMSLLYECINTVIAVLISISSGMPNHSASIQLCVQKLRILIEDTDQNLKYLGLLAMSKILKTHPKSVQAHKDLILQCLDDKDESIRLRALDLLYGMVSKKNLMEIVKKLMVHMDKAEGTNYRDELLCKVIDICSQNNYQYITNFEWKLPSMIDSIVAKKEAIKETNVAKGVNMLMKQRSQTIEDAILLDNAHLLVANTQRNSICEVLFAAAWICGEFSEIAFLQKLHLTILYLFRPLRDDEQLPVRTHHIVMPNKVEEKNEKNKIKKKKERESGKQHKVGKNDMNEMVDDIPVAHIDLTVPLHIPGLISSDKYLNTHNIKTKNTQRKNKKKKRKTKKGKHVLTDSEDDISAVHEVTILKEEMPDGARLTDDEDDDDRNPDDPHKALDINLDEPLRDDEQLPVRTHHIVMPNKVEEKNEKNKIKKKKERESGKQHKVGKKEKMKKNKNIEQNKTEDIENIKVIEISEQNGRIEDQLIEENSVAAKNKKNEKNKKKKWEKEKQKEKKSKKEKKKRQRTHHGNTLLQEDQPKDKTEYEEAPGIATPSKEPGTSISQTPLTPSMPLPSNYKLLGEDKNIKMTYEIRTLQNVRNEIVVSVIFNNLSDCHIKELEFNVLDTLNTKMVRNVSIDFMLHYSSEVLMTEIGSTHEKLEFKLHLPVSSYLIGTTYKRDTFAELLSSAELTVKSSFQLESVGDLEFSHILSKICFYCHFTVVEQVGLSASLYSRSIQDDHICLLVKHLNPNRLSVDGKSTNDQLLSSLLDEIKQILSPQNSIST